MIDWDRWEKYALKREGGGFFKSCQKLIRGGGVVRSSPKMVDVNCEWSLGGSEQWTFTTQAMLFPKRNLFKSNIWQKESSTQCRDFSLSLYYVRLKHDKGNVKNVYPYFNISLIMQQKYISAVCAIKILHRCVMQWFMQQKYITLIFSAVCAIKVLHRCVLVQEYRVTQLKSYWFR